ncbi:F-box family protein [Rhynchospora pubera]|uniref:F-box family protein n=1 Tax=Rhynchospora pubera TaxID=906938 RepID=A0AAV8FXN9_9POAL|nr:F-box family protein [Rhynchospora pubera]
MRRMMSGADRISVLPEETKVSILSLLPIADAVRTSVLSHSWRHLWTLLPGFHADLNPRSGPIRRPENVDRILSSLCGPIRHFSLNCSLLASQPLCLQHFLDLIFQKDGLCILSLQCTGLLVRVQLPYFYSLKNLQLSCISISLPSDFCGFKQLTSLKLYHVVISQQDIQSLIDGSKKLTSIQLRIHHYNHDAANKQPLSVTFNCPLLRYLRFNFGNEDVEGRIVSAPCLESTHVTASTVRYIPRLEDLVSVGAASLKFMADIAHVSHLSLNFHLLMCLSRVDVPCTLQNHFRQLKCLKLIGEMCCTDRRMYKVLCCLLRSMPFLERLELQCREPLGYEEGEHPNELDPIPPYEYKKKEDGYLCLNQTLRRLAIFMKNLSDLDDLIWMIHFILVNANALELIEITYSYDRFKVKSRIIEELCQVEKASTNAHVVFEDTRMKYKRYR